MVELKSIAVTMALLLMFMNAAPGLLIASGVADDWGVNPQVGGDDRVEAANENMSDVRPTGGFASTLFQLYNSAAGTVEALFSIIIGGPLMLLNIGIPSWAVAFVFVPQYVIVGGAMIYVLAGRML